MPEPEIAKRCPSCGASIRSHAFFCPQCGRELAHPDFSQTLPIQPAHEKAADQITTPAAPDLKASRPTGRDTLSDSSPPPPVERPAVATPEAIQTARGAVGAKIQRATNRAREVEGDMLQRARKVREISGVVIDEAGYDPSLRFVLVAAVLFLLFLLIVILNKFIT
jgi:hypothetical protein